MSDDHRTDRRRLRAVPATHEHDPSDQERDAMNETGSTNSGNERDSQPAAVPVRWARAVFVEPWNAVVCAVIGLTLDLAVVLVGVHFVRNGVIPAWVDAHGGHWTWMALGALAAVFLGELLDNVARLYHSVWDALDRRQMRAIADRLAAAGLDRPGGGEHR